MSKSREQKNYYTGICIVSTQLNINYSVVFLEMPHYKQIKCNGQLYCQAHAFATYIVHYHDYT